MPQYHTVAQGECLSGIAHRYGFADYRALYDHPQNADIRRKRPNPNVVFPGDAIFIPDPDVKEVGAQTDRIHRFVRRLPQRKLHLRLLDLEGAPLRDSPCVLGLGDETRERRTDADGVLDEDIPIDLDEVSLTLAGVTWTLRVGHLNPLSHLGDDVSGVQARLRNLGFNPGPIDGRLGKRTRAALRAFQLANGLLADSECSPAVLHRLREIHGC